MKTRKEINSEMTFETNSNNDRFYSFETKINDKRYKFSFETHSFDPTFFSRIDVIIETDDTYKEVRFGETITTKKEAVNEIYEYLNNN